MRVVSSTHQAEKLLDPPVPDDQRLRMSEADMQYAIVELAQALRWHVYHTHDSRRSAKGFPDLVLCNGRRTIYAELKSTKGKTTDDQDEWLQVLADAGNHVFVWRPHDWFTGDIERELRGKRL